MTTAGSKSTRTDRGYVLGTDHVEVLRLGLQHRLWSAQAHKLWELAGVKPGVTVLDLGCGPGHATMDIAQIVGGASEGGPRGRVIAVDESAGFLKQLHDDARARRLTNIDRVLADVHDLDAALPNATGTIDIAYARWVFCFLTRPEEVVKSLSRLVKPGGRVAIQDYFNYEAMSLAPRREIFTRIIHAIGASWRSHGGDPDVIARMPRLLIEAGFEISHLDVSQRVARPNSPVWHWPDTFWASYIPRLVETGFVQPDERDAFNLAWREASADPATFMVLPPVFDLVAVKK